MYEIEFAVDSLIKWLVERTRPMQRANAGAGDATRGAPNRAANLVWHTFGTHPLVQQAQREAGWHAAVSAGLRAQLVQLLQDKGAHDTGFLRALTTEVAACVWPDTRATTTPGDPDNRGSSGPHPDPGIDIVLESPDDEVRLNGFTEWLWIEVGSKQAQPRRIGLQARGLPGQGNFSWIEPQVVTVTRDRPGRAKIQLRRTGVSPMAGAHSLVVVGEDIDRPGLRWTSNPRTIVVPQLPGVENHGLDVRSRTHSTWYRCALTVSNTGNVPLRPLVVIPENFDKEVKSLLDRGHIRIPDQTLRVEPGGTGTYDVDLCLGGRRLWRRTWHVPLVVDYGQPALPPTVGLRIVRPGLLVPGRKRAAPGPGPAGEPAPGLGPNHATRVIALTMATLALLLIIFLVGRVVRPPHVAGSSTPAPDVTTPTSAPGDAQPGGRQEAQAIANLLGQAEQDRPKVESAVNDAEACGPGVADGADVQALQAIQADRQRLATQAAGLPVGDVAGASQLPAELSTAMAESAKADGLYASWVEQLSDPCDPDTAQQASGFTSANQVSTQADDDKRVFAQGWNTIAGRYGQQRLSRDGGEL